MYVTCRISKYIVQISKSLQQISLNHKIYVQKRLNNLKTTSTYISFSTFSPMRFQTEIKALCTEHSKPELHVYSPRPTFESSTVRDSLMALRACVLF